MCECVRVSAMLATGHFPIMQFVIKMAKSCKHNLNRSVPFWALCSHCFVVSVSKSKCVFTFMCTIRFTSCLKPTYLVLVLSLGDM